MPHQQKKSWPSIRRPTARRRPSSSSPRPAPRAPPICRPPPQAAPLAATPWPQTQRAGLHRRAHGPCRIQPGTRTREEVRRLQQGRRRAPAAVRELDRCRYRSAPAPPHPPLPLRPAAALTAAAGEGRAGAREEVPSSLTAAAGEGRARSACSPTAAQARSRRRCSPGHGGAELARPKPAMRELTAARSLPARRRAHGSAEFAHGGAELARPEHATRELHCEAHHSPRPHAPREPPATTPWPPPQRARRHGSGRHGHGWRMEEERDGPQARGPRGPRSRPPRSGRGGRSEEGGGGAALLALEKAAEGTERGRTRPTELGRRRPRRKGKGQRRSRARGRGRG
ncbi:hypothetical protein PVAP13_3KG080527 [Panicum virgatum]|uniref:Uncharacterized protein n=1 Tax=Panicum virgatum TaxID=38727 RepID=A0A8T0UNZ6_PANVG|nr:hypothetical protein PVAP13_3KG080527 [Panicum virgatum]